MNRFLSILFWICSTASPVIFAQERDVEIGFYTWFDDVIGYENTAIFNGVEYTEKHRMINEKHKFFLSSLFKPGTVNYEEQVFYNVKMIYNIFEDLVIVRLPKKAGGEATFQLHPGKIQGFEIDGHKFINITSNIIDSGITGIHEIIYEDEKIKLLKKHVRRIFLKRDASYPYHEFNDPGGVYVVYVNGEYKTILNRGEVISTFPEYEVLIKDHYKEHRKLQKSDPDRFFTGLIESIGPRINSKVQ
ncbi:MAG TPA: hypothetical protein VLN46_04590 [Gillisia sp.]|nr:hypothetical protein [Gillisia sp.]